MYSKRSTLFIGLSLYQNLNYINMNKFTQKMMLVIACIIASCINVQAQYQLPDPGFEQTWRDVSGKGGLIGTTNVTGKEPVGFHSFITASIGSGFGLTSAVAKQLEPSTTVLRPGTTGTTSAKIWSRSPMGSIIANGNMTTGRIFGGSTTPTDASGNYNFSDPSASEYNQPFTGQPDAITAWVKYEPAKTTPSKGSNLARVSAIIHENSRYQDPEATTYTNVVAKAQLNYAPAANNDWQQLSIPFVYEKTTVPSYILLTFTTNKTPGEGSVDDAVYIDDIEFIYNSKLESLKIEGVALTDFAKDTYSYTILQNGATPTPEQITAISDGKGASVDKNISGNVATITVSGNDISVNSENKHIYTLTFRDTRSQLSSLSISGTPLNGFSKDTYNYTILGDGTVPALDQITAEAESSDAKIDKSINGSIITITVSGYDIETNPTNKHVYTITYQDIRSQLSSLSIGGTALDGFNKDTYSYTVLGDGTVPALDQIVAIADGNGATVDKSINGNVVTITVSGSNIESDPTNKHVYTITYQDTRSQLSSLSIGGTALDGFDKDTYSYTVSGTVPEKDQITAEADGNGATVNIEINGKVITITVSGSNIATDPTNKHVYTITFDYEQSIENNATTEGIKVYSANGNVFIQGYTGTVEIYLLNGGKIAQKEVSGNKIFRLEPNTYIIRTGTKATTVIVK